MLNTPFKIVFLVFFLIQETIRTPHRKRNARARRQKDIALERARGIDIALDLLAYLGMAVIPVVHSLSTFFDFANASLPSWLGWLGAGLLALATILLWKAHADLGKNWSPSIQILPEHRLVSEGIYRAIRHPIYAAVWLSVIAQALLLSNWIVGPLGMLFFLPVYVTRVPREEQMMLEQFGEEYRTYMQQTGRLLPRLKH